MIDTVKLRMSKGLYVPKNASTYGWQSATYSDPDLQTGGYRKNTVQALTQNGVALRIHNNGRLLTIEASLPKLIYGNNLSRVSQPTAALKQLREVARDLVTGPIPGLADTECLRVDFCYNFFVGDQLPDYLAAISKLPHSRQRFVYNGAHSIEWSSKNGRRIILYDKDLEMQHNDRIIASEAKGILRFEVQVRKKSGFLQRRLNTQYLVTGDVVSAAVAYACLGETIAAIGMDRTFKPADIAGSVLATNFSGSTVNRLLGLHHRLQTEPLETVKRSMGRSTFFEGLRQLKRVGLWPVSMSSVELSPLKLPPIGELISDQEIKIASGN
jgi:hypothetical protein